MSKYTISSVITLFIVTVFIFPTLTNDFIVRGDIESYHELDYDPFIDIILSFEVISIRGYVETDEDAVPNFSVLLNINDEQFLSPNWGSNRYLYDINWTVNKNVPDNNPEVIIKIQLIDNDAPCDIGGSLDNNTVEIIYDIRTNHWFGDDFIGDSSGYGRLNGCDDGSYYEEEKDCEIWFNIYQNDLDNDTIPTWAEINLYGSSPFIDNSIDDFDNDGIPYYWEHHWNYAPNIWDDHKSLDPDDDGLTNIEEFLTSEWFSDPYRRDLFIELDQMDFGPNGEGFRVPNSTKDLLADRYNPRNIVYHLDDGCMGGGELIPFDYLSLRGEILDIYDNYFLHNDPDNWRRGVFRYAVFIHDNFRASAYAFVGEGRIINSNVRGINSFQITTTSVNKAAKRRNVPIDFICACFIMHETGHTLGVDIFNPFGCDSIWSTRPWRLPFWIFHNYKSVMNYKYTFRLLDYSDGSHGFFDHDDWGNLDFTWFQFREN